MLQGMNLTDIALLLEAGATYETAGIVITDLAYDSRQVTPGALFFCIDGGSVDGHSFAGAALEAGAVAFVCERPVSLPRRSKVPQLFVESSRAAMNQLAASFFGFPSRSIELVGITGTNGKTTTTFMLDSIFRVSDGTSGMIGTVECRIGERRIAAARTTPESIDLQRMLKEMVDLSTRRCAVEATSIGLDRGRTKGTEFDVAVFTNLTLDHLDHHQTMDRYFSSKAKLFLDPPPGAALINADDAYGRKLSALTSGRTLTFGLQRPADYRAEQINLGIGGSEFTVVGPGINHKLKVNLAGSFNVSNALAAFGCSHLMGIQPEAAAGGIEALTHVPGRFEPVEQGQSFHVFVDYAHTPDGLENVLQAARILCKGRLIVVFGCGGDRDKTKRPLMGRVSARYADMVIVTSDNPRSEDPGVILAEIELGLIDAPPVGGYRVVEDREEAIRWALNEAGAQDIVVIAGKGHESGQELGGKVTAFDDRLVAAGILQELA